MALESVAQPRIKAISIKNFTVFSDVQLKFSSKLNIIVGDNGAGKTHLLKLLYSIVHSLCDQPRSAPIGPTKAGLQSRLAEEISTVFLPESLGRLARRQPGRQRCDVRLDFTRRDLSILFGFATNSKSEVSIEEMPSIWLGATPAYLPTRELLAIAPGFPSVYESVDLPFESTWNDTCILLGRPLQRGPKEEKIRQLLKPLEEAMGGAIELERGGRFYLRTADGRMEMPLVAEGMRKLGMVARLIATGALLENGYLFWDEPEAGLNPKLLKRVAKTIVDLAFGGIQIFVATHSLFLMREFEILLAQKSYSSVSPQFFGLHVSRSGVEVEQGKNIANIGRITSLDEDLNQSDRFLGLDL